MRGKTWLPLVLVTAATATIVLGLAGSASGAARSGPASHFQLLKGGLTGNIHAAQLPLGVSNKPTGFILQLKGKPIAVRDAAAKDAGRRGLSSLEKRAAMQQLAAQQNAVAQAAKNLGATVTARFQYVYNGIAVRLPAYEAYKLGQLAGVKAVYRTRVFKHANINSVPLIGGPATWGGVPGYTGTGMKIADIDTGLDYTHADFGGSGSVDDWDCAVANSTADPSTVTCPGGPVSQWYGATAPKVKGGWDFVGDDYNADSSGPGAIPHPDPNPLDCYGHGTHTAGTAAGFGVLSNGSTYDGPYDASTITDNTWNVGPGVAPNASIYALRVFGCDGSVDDTVLISAMDWSVANGMDVINMSLGGDWGSPLDPDSVAASNTAKDGVIVVSASGNAGPTPYITSSPAAGRYGLSVAANDSTETFPGANLALTTAGDEDGGSMSAINANGFDFDDGNVQPAGHLQLAGRDQRGLLGS